MILPSRDGDFDLTDDLLAGLQVKYPQLNVRDEMLKANLWLAKNPASRPLLVLRFLERWLAKSKPAYHAPRLVGKLSEQEILSMAKSKGIEPRPGESWEKLLRRVRA